MSPVLLWHRAALGVQTLFPGYLRSSTVTAWLCITCSYFTNVCNREHTSSKVHLILRKTRDYQLEKQLGILKFGI